MPSATFQVTVLRFIIAVAVMLAPHCRFTPSCVSLRVTRPTSGKILHIRILLFDCYLLFTIAFLGISVESMEVINNLFHGNLGQFSVALLKSLPPKFRYTMMDHTDLFPFGDHRDFPIDVNVHMLSARCVERNRVPNSCMFSSFSF